MPRTKSTRTLLVYVSMFVCSPTTAFIRCRKKTHKDFSFENRCRAYAHAPQSRTHTSKRLSQKTTKYAQAHCSMPHLNRQVTTCIFFCDHFNFIFIAFAISLACAQQQQHKILNYMFSVVVSTFCCLLFVTLLIYVLFLLFALHKMRCTWNIWLFTIRSQAV